MSLTSNQPVERALPPTDRVTTAEINANPSIEVLPKRNIFRRMKDRFSNAFKHDRPVEHIPNRIEYTPPEMRNARVAALDGRPIGVINVDDKNDHSGKYLRSIDPADYDYYDMDDDEDYDVYPYNTTRVEPAPRSVITNLRTTEFVTGPQIVHTVVTQPGYTIPMTNSTTTVVTNIESFKTRDQIIQEREINYNDPVVTHSHCSHVHGQPMELDSRSGAMIENLDVPSERNLTKQRY